MTSDIPELKVGQVWKAPGDIGRRIEHIYYHDGKPWDVEYTTEIGRRMALYPSWRAWARKTGARP